MIQPKETLFNRLYIIHQDLTSNTGIINYIEVFFWAAYNQLGKHLNSNKIPKNDFCQMKNLYCLLISIKFRHENEVKNKKKIKIPFALISSKFIF